MGGCGELVVESGCVSVLGGGAGGSWVRVACKYAHACVHAHTHSDTILKTGNWQLLCMVCVYVCILSGMQ